MEQDKRHEKSWNDPPLFSIEQLNKASNTVPLSKRYRYPQQAQQQAPNQAYQQNVGPGYGFSGPQVQPQNSSVQGFAQQQYPTSYSPFMDPNANALQPSANYPSQANQPQQYSQFGSSQQPVGNAFAANPAYVSNANQINPNQYAGSTPTYNTASQFAGQFSAQPQPPQPPQMYPNYQSQPYNPQARY